MLFEVVNEMITKSVSIEIVLDPSTTGGEFWQFRKGLKDFIDTFEHRHLIREVKVK